MLLQISVYFCDGDANAPVALRRRAPETHRHQNYNRHDRQHEAGQSRAQAQHHEDYKRQHQNVADNGHQARGKQIIQHIHVGGDARYQAPDRILIEVGDIEPLQVSHELTAQIKHRLLSCPLHQVRLSEIKKETEYDDTQVDQGNLGQSCEAIMRQPTVKERQHLRVFHGRQVAVDRQLCEQRSDNLKNRIDEQ